MGLFGPKKNQELEQILFAMKMNVENNYKDASLQELKNFREAYERLSPALSEKQKALYGGILSDYEARLKNYSHGDQKPYWTKES